MEPVLVLSYYVQLQEYLRSSVSCSATPEPRLIRQQDLTRLLCSDAAPLHLTESNIPDAAAREDATPAEAGDLDEAFETIIEEMKFDWPEFSPTDRIRAGLIESTLGLLLFLGLIAGAVLLHQSFGHQP